MRQMKISLLLAILAGLLSTNLASAATSNRVYLVNDSGYPDQEIYLVVWSSL